MDLDPPTRDALHRVAAHVLSRRRYQLTGHLGLRASPGGFATPAFGDADEVLRVSNGVMIREATGQKVAQVEIAGTSMQDLASFASVDLAGAYSCGPNGPALGDTHEPLTCDRGAAIALAEWLSQGWQAIDQVVAALAGQAQAEMLQLWPEHFDAASSVAFGDEVSVNLGVSPGDTYHDAPYAYVGPWGPERPGDPGFWNAPFGAVLSWRTPSGVPIGVDGIASFLAAGLKRLQRGR